ncbi:hypothetical protein CEQ90_18300 [Lewinellaceae bacterium SD302]|nr:hypothetical protein CEQ90_18300 [Lewinellaceae bacterium SD302]
MLLASCGSDTNESTVDSRSNHDCSHCPIGQNTSESTTNTSAASKSETDIGGSLNAGIPIAKKYINAELTGKGGYDKSEEVVEEVYWKIAGGDDDLTQYANLYRTVNCALLQLVCEDDSLSTTQKREMSAAYVEAYGEKVEEIVARSIDKKRQTDLTRPENTPPVSPPAPAAEKKNGSTFNTNVKGENKGQIIQGETINIGTINSGGDDES